MAAKSRLALIGLMALALAAPAAAQRGASEGGEITLAALEPQTLAPGRCGMFLWSRGEQPAFVFVAYDNPASALVKFNGREQEMPRQAFSGGVLAGHFEQQSFARDGVTLDVRVRADESRPVRDGAIINDGVIRVIEANGWQSVVPVGGMIACQPAPQ